jgi:hypothetical protein
MGPTSPASDAATSSGGSTSPLLLAALASVGAGVIHAAAVGIHTEHVGLTRLFILVAVAQIGAAVFAFLRPSARLAAGALVAVNLAAFAGWLYTRLAGISWIAGLEQSERAQPADTIAALLALGAVIGAGAFLVRRADLLARVPVAVVATLIAAFTVPAMVNATNHQHDHGSDHASGDDSAHGDDHPHDGQDGVAAAASHGDDDHHADEHQDDEHHADEHQDDETPRRRRAPRRRARG